MWFKNSRILGIAIIIGIITGCREDEPLPPPPDISEIEVSLDMARFSEAFFAEDSTHLLAHIHQLYATFPGFAPCYFEHIVGVAPAGKPVEHWLPRAAQLYQYPGLRASFDSVQAAFPDLTNLEASLTKAFRYHKYYHPQIPVPAIRTFVSEYGYGAVACNDTVIGIGLDLYLGEDFSFYPALRFPEYLLHRMTPEYILPNTMQAFWQNHLPQPGPSAPLLDQMVYYGKLLLYTDLTLPHLPDRLKIGYTEEEWAWVTASEAEIWAYLLDNDRLYMDNISDYGYLINEGPTTQGMPPESPGRVGRYIGWQIVRAYYRQYPDQLDQLWALQDGQQLLERAQYKPKK